MKPADLLFETAIASLCGGTALVAQLAAEAASPNLPAVDFGNLTSTAILGWYAWHTTTRAIPQLVADFRQELQEHREAFRRELAAERDSHRALVFHLGADQIDKQ
jgi:Spy/CpxP family protein refolding chaperone